MKKAALDNLDDSLKFKIQEKFNEHYMVGENVGLFFDRESDEDEHLVFRFISKVDGKWRSTQKIDAANIYDLMKVETAAISVMITEKKLFQIERDSSGKCIGWLWKV